MVCTYCNSANPHGSKTCVNCGAPLVQGKPISESQSGSRKIPEFKPRPIIKPRSKNTISRKNLETAQKAGKNMEKVVSGTIYIYAVFWRTLAESVVIAITALSLGIFGGSTDMVIWGILSGVIIGVAVGLAIKNYYLVLLSAPLGFILGTTIGGMLWAVGIGPKVLVFTTVSLASIFALLGSRKYPYAMRNKWEKSRPYLGGLGGLVFALLGTLVGIQIRDVLIHYIDK